MCIKGGSKADSLGKDDSIKKSSQMNVGYVLQVSN